jgi:hypothetical protein
MKLAIIILVTTTSNLLSQSDSAVSFKLPELEITQMENGKKIIYEFENSTNRFFISDSFLVANPQKYNYKVNIQDISKLRVIHSTHIAPIMVAGFAIGGLLGAGLAGFGAHPTNPTTGELVFAILIGGGALSLLAGGIAFLISHDDEYMFNENMSIKKRKEMLLEAMRNNKK